MEREFKGNKMESDKIPKSWLTTRLEPHDVDWERAVEQLHPESGQ